MTSTVSFELELCQTNTTFENLQTCIGMVRKNEDNAYFMETIGLFIIVIILAIILYSIWKKGK